MSLPKPNKNESPAEYADRLGQVRAQVLSVESRKSLGQFLTPLDVARVMAGYYRTTRREISILDPGAGSGVLACALCERLLSNRSKPTKIGISAVEVDAEMVGYLNAALDYLRSYAQARGCELHFEVIQDDFILRYADELSDNRNMFKQQKGDRYDTVISNPPYFKIPKSDPRARAAQALVHGQPNIYALFMGLSARLLKSGGKLIFITPRSFASGPYFKRFREVFFSEMRPNAIHTFDSRKKAFSRDSVLQENVILLATRHPEWQASARDAKLTLSTSEDAQPSTNRLKHQASISSLLDFESPNLVLRIPETPKHARLLQEVSKWSGSLDKYGLKVSTGPVVPFRAKDYLTFQPDRRTVPLLWMNNVSPLAVRWPLEKMNKPQYIVDSKDSRKLLVPASTYVLIRRFSAKEDKRRLVAAVVDGSQMPTKYIGIENHLNYIYGVEFGMSMELAYGLAAVLNSEQLDKFFRISNGNTQVSATELRELPLPPLDDISKLGSDIMGSLCDVDRSNTWNPYELIQGRHLFKALAYE